jgi:hypothetical protein
VRSHFALTRNAALACVAFGAAAFAPSPSAAVTIAHDTATNPIYADGWSAGENGGFGFGPWSFTGTYSSPVQQAMDFGTSPHNQLGTAWTLYNPLGPTPGPEANDGTDIARAGRSFAPLQVGDTLKIVLDNPTERNFFRGWNIQLHSGSENTVYGSPIPTRLNIGTFEYFTYGQWFDGNGNAPLFDTDTSDGLTIEVVLTGLDTYELRMISPGNPTHTESSSLQGVAGTPIQYIEFEYYGTDSDFHPPPPIGGRLPQETDFYISSLEIVRQQTPEPAGLSLLAAGLAPLAWLRRRFGKRTPKT